jgi:PAS domain S-box-containing protein
LPYWEGGWPTVVSLAKTDRDFAFAQAIVDTIQEPILVLDEDLRVLGANRRFYQIFSLTAEQTENRMLGEVGAGQWDLPALRVRLRQIVPDNAVLDKWEVELDFTEMGHRIFLLSARRLFDASGVSRLILLTMTDITEQRGHERERDELLRQKDVLLEEMEHRVANSLAIIAGILMMKARTVNSPETRAHLEDAHHRVMSVATVQKHLHQSEAAASIDLRSYLAKLCAGLAGSMINNDSCAIDTSGVSTVSVTSATATSIGLIVTELVINALKHAFPVARPGCVIVVAHEINGTDWKLSVADNGIGGITPVWPERKLGLGSSIVSALAESLSARVETISGSTGTTVSITHSTFKSVPKAA